MTWTSKLVACPAVALVVLIAGSPRAETPDGGAGREAATAAPRPPAPVLLSVQAIPDPPPSAGTPANPTNHRTDAPRPPSADVSTGDASVRAVAGDGPTR